MDWDQLDLHPRVKAAVRRAQISSISSVLVLSSPVLQTRTGLSCSDVQQLLIVAAAACRGTPPIQAVLLKTGPGPRLSLGCPVLDRLLRGGLHSGGISELSGQSGAGKTQLGLQLCLSVQYPEEYGGLGSGAVFISTEDSFPVRRLQQLISEQPCLRSDVPPSVISSLKFSDNIYIEHTADLVSLQTCVSRRVPLLLSRGLVRFLVVDSVAALFRSEFEASDWLERNKQLLTLSSCLHHLSHEFNIPVLCINQVTDVFNDSEHTLGPLRSSVSPALGLAWSNQVMVRLMMRRLQGTVAREDQSSTLRRLEVVFAPHVASGGCDAAVWREGVCGVHDGK
ncbi:DNA repair protein XRCC3 [Sphaeramia orbicularis]|uniref:RecA family profile 1 domain-containing protein n=1 Tax=Sphaeramia orbicularis TaxID=375764 RepID=A0A673ACS8_9TELE|nr:DNA repair protein XRCC3 [Sphaeramia orbicularis]